jgi:hypothetical protein
LRRRNRIATRDCQGASVAAGGARDEPVAAVKDADFFRERVLDVANVCERDLLARTAATGVSVPRTSLVAAFIEHVNRTKSQDYLPRFLDIAKAVVEHRTVFVNGDHAEVLADHGIGQVTANDIDRDLTVQSLTVSEPLVPKMLIAVALELDPTVGKGLHPVVSVLNNMAATLETSVHGFLVEVLAVPVIHNFLAQHFNAGTALPAGVLRHAKLLDGLQHDDSYAFAPEHAAGPDALHTFARRGALGQIKFRASMSDAEWADALRTVDRAQLYSEKPSDKPLTEKGEKQRVTRQANKAELRRQANARLDTLWPDGYCSYIFTICEPQFSAICSTERHLDERPTLTNDRQRNDRRGHKLMLDSC